MFCIKCFYKILLFLLFGLPAGVYFVQVDGGEMLKFVKE